MDIHTSCRMLFLLSISSLSRHLTTAVIQPGTSLHTPQRRHGMIAPFCRTPQQEGVPETVPCTMIRKIVVSQQHLSLLAVGGASDAHHADSRFGMHSIDVQLAATFSSLDALAVCCALTAGPRTCRESSNSRPNVPASSSLSGPLSK